VLLALEYLQKQRIAHRDVRSDNLLLNSHGVLKLSEDFLVPDCGSDVLNDAERYSRLFQCRAGHASITIAF